MMDGFARVIGGIVVGPALRYAQDTIEELEREGADLVISAELLMGVVAACEKLGQKVALLPSNSMIITIKAALEQAAASSAPPANEQEARMAAIAAMRQCAAKRCRSAGQARRDDGEALGLGPARSGEMIDCGR